MLDIIDQIIKDGLEGDLLHLGTGDDGLDSAHMHINGKNLVNFGSCSYLGLEYSEILKQGGIEAIKRFGTQFSSSRTYVSVGLYETLEEELAELFGQPVIATASTTLGHLSALPVLIEKDDAVILDLQVHSSIRMAVQILKANHIKTYVIPHNAMDHLESKIKALRNKHRRIWYLADGVYSMYGDFAPLDRLVELMDTYKQFHLYVDDAHGMSWVGEMGRGYVRSQVDHHPKMVMATSLNKGFAAAGGLLIFPDEEMRARVRNCGSTLIFSGPIQPPMLGVGIASARLHKSPELKRKQDSLREKIAYTNRRLDELGLPQFQASESPLFFIPVGLPHINREVLMRMKENGYYLNAASFPAVPMKKGGLRFMITDNHELADIEGMLSTMQREYVLGLKAQGSSTEEVAQIFELPPIHIELEKQVVGSTQVQLVSEVYESVEQIGEEQWNRFHCSNGTLNYRNLLRLEKIFRGRPRVENNWRFEYQVLKDPEGNTVLAAVYSVALMMDDLLAIPEISLKVKEMRKEDRYYLTSKTLMSGTPFTKGQCLCIDYGSPHWEAALELHVKHLLECAEKHDVQKIILRDFDHVQAETLRETMRALGLIETRLPNNCVVEDLNWIDRSEFMSRLDQKYRYCLKKEILKYEDQFELVTTKPATEAEKRACFELYRNVHRKALDISVFELPYALFEMMCESPEYDVLRLHLKSDPEKPVAVMFSQMNKGQYNALVVGLDYDYVRSHNSYKQILFRTVERAHALGHARLDLAYTAEMQKKKVGAKPQPTYAYLLALDHLAFAEMDALK